MTADEHDAAAGKIIEATLEIVKRVSLDPRILRKVGMKVLISSSGAGMAPLITVEFLGVPWKKKTIEAEFAVFWGPSLDDVAGHVFAGVMDDEAKTFDILLNYVNPKTMKEFELYFEKVMSMYAEMESKE